MLTRGALVPGKLATIMTVGECGEIGSFAPRSRAELTTPRAPEAVYHASTVATTERHDETRPDVGGPPRTTHLLTRGQLSISLDASTMRDS